MVLNNPAQSNFGLKTGLISAIDLEAVSILNGCTTLRESDFDHTVSLFNTNG